MSTLLHPLSLSMIRDAADDIVSDALAWAKYSTEIAESVDEIITDTLEELAREIESAPVTERDEVADIISDFCDKVASELEDSRGNGLASEMVDGDVIYTSDIMDYYVNNMNDVDDALSDAYGDLSDFDTIGAAMAVGVALALCNVAESEISEVMSAFETWAREEMTNQIFS